MSFRPTVLKLLVLCTASLGAMQRLPEEYCIVFGNREAQMAITEYFSFACPHCIALFKEEFSKIQSEIIDSGKARFDFHPVPLDINTVQAMVCMEKLNEDEKRAFLSAVMSLAEDDSDLNTQLMMKAMEIFGKAIPELNQKEYLMKTRAFQEAFLFLKQDDHIEAIPSLSVNGVLYPEEIPTFDLLEKLVMEAKGV